MLLRHAALWLIGTLSLISHRPATAIVPPPFPTQFEVIEILPLSGDEQTWAKGVNDDGWVTGFSLDTDPNPDTSRPFLWNPKTGLTQVISNLAQSMTFGEGAAINDSNFIAGTFKATPGVSFTGFLNMGEFLHFAAPLQNQDDVIFDDISFSGRACGAAKTTGGYEAVRYALGTLQPLGFLPFDTSSRALGISGNDSVCGISYGANVLHPNAFFYDGSMHQLQTLGGSYAAAFGINTTTSVGFAHIAGDSAYHACAWTNFNNPPQDFDTLTGATHSAFHDINNLDDIVGWSESNGSPDHRAVVAPTGATQIIDLNTFLPPASDWILREAWDISDSRLIVGIGEKNGIPRGFLLRPIPAPGIIAYYDFIATSGLQGWTTLTNIPPFAEPLIYLSIYGLVLSPNDQFNVFGIAQSPNIPISNNTRYRAVFEVTSNFSDPSLVPQFRLRVGQQVVNTAWVMNVDSVGSAAPVLGQTLRYEFDFIPNTSQPGQDVFMAIDITHFNPLDSTAGSIWLERAWIEIAEKLPLVI